MPCAPRRNAAPGAGSRRWAPARSRLGNAGAAPGDDGRRVRHRDFARWRAISGRGHGTLEGRRCQQARARPPRRERHRRAGRGDLGGSTRAIGSAVVLPRHPGQRPVRQRGDPSRPGAGQVDTGRRAVADGWSAPRAIDARRARFGEFRRPRGQRAQAAGALGSWRTAPIVATRGPRRCPRGGNRRGPRSRHPRRGDR